MGKSKITLATIQEIAANRGGRCLSESYKNNTTKLLWSCAQGHTWRSTYAQVAKYGWCARCQGKPVTDKEERLKELHQLASSRGGFCRSSVYVVNKSDIHFTCKVGHEFSLSFNEVSSAKRWCPSCRDLNNSYSLERIKEHVSKANGEIVSLNGRLYSDPIKLRCKSGHEWESIVGNLVYYKKWCPECAKTRNGPRLTLERLKDFAKIKGGECLSKKFHGRMKPHSFKCDQGHTWNSSAFSVFYSKSWCPKCFSEKRGNSKEDCAAGLLRLQDHALKLGGACLSSTYASLNDSFEFRCKRNHSWNSLGRNVVFNKTWCPECSGKAGETYTLVHARFLTNFVFFKVRPKWLKGKKGHALELDAYCEEQKFAIEYQGKQHYEFIPGWHKTLEYFEECKARDQLKREVCAAHGVLLFEVPYIDRPTPERIAAHVEREAQKACLPFTINPDYRAMLAELATAKAADALGEEFTRGILAGETDQAAQVA